MPFGLPSPHCHISQHLAINILIYIHSTGSILQLNSNWKDKTYCKNYIIFSSVRLLSHVRLFATPWTTACQASLSITNSQSPPKPMSIESVMSSNHLIFCRPLLLLPSIFPCLRKDIKVILKNSVTNWMRGERTGILARISALETRKMSQKQ